MNFKLTFGKVAAISFVMSLMFHGVIGTLALMTLMVCGVCVASKNADV
ncbi:MAG: hypothetical protein KBS60_04110 [Phascolarctobacterium sp.]|nr:hypothetical protein [Candidatus Phascolarctobacterium caballi]